MFKKASSHILAWLRDSLFLPIRPNNDSLADVKQNSKDKWFVSILVFSLLASLAIGAATILSGLDFSIGEFFATVIVLGLMQFAWATTAQFSAFYLVDRRAKLFEPLLYLSSSALLLLFVLTVLSGILPPPQSIISFMFLIYSQILVVLSIRYFSNATLWKSVLVQVISGIFGIVVLFMIISVITGMPGFFERGYLR